MADQLGFNPWDQTIWDPFDLEHAIEDPLHGPTAVHDMLQIPAMPRGDGTYYQPGAFYAYGTANVNSYGRPVNYIHESTETWTREGFELREWFEAYQEGEDALTALEASRQQKRLQKTGFAHTYKPSDVCPGGKKLEDCETGNAAYQAGQEWAGKNDKEKPGDGRISNVIAWAGSKCVGCSVSCQVAVKTIDGKPQETRVSFYKSNPTSRLWFQSQTTIDNCVDRHFIEDLIEDASTCTGKKGFPYLLIFLQQEEH